MRFSSLGGGLLMSHLKVKLSDLIEGIDFQSDNLDVYLNMKTGEVIYIEDELYSLADSDRDLSNYPEWQQESIKLADEVMYEDYFEPFPSKYEINEYRMMEIFSYSMEKEIKERLLRAINGRGAFRRFKDEVFELDVREDWFNYREEELKKLLKKWCQTLDIEIIE